MTEKISIYKAGHQAILKVLLTCALWALLFAVGGAILFAIGSESFTWYPSVFSGTFGLLIGLRIYRQTYSGLYVIAVAIGFLVGLIIGTLTVRASSIMLGLLFAVLGSIFVMLPNWAFRGG